MVRLMRVPVMVLGTVLNVVTALSAAAITSRAATVAEVPKSVQVAKLPVTLQGPLHTVGQHLLAPGKEQITLQALVTEPGSKPAPATVVILSGGKINVALADRVVSSDGAALFSAQGAPSDEDADLVETLLNDTFDNLITAASGGATLRYMGSRFALSSGAAAYAGPYFDIYVLSDKALDKDKVSAREKAYLLNSATGFPEQIIYQTNKGSKAISVTTMLSGWKAFGSDYYPGHIVRLEDGAATITVDILSAGYGPATAGTSFGSGK